VKFSFVAPEMGFRKNLLSECKPIKKQKSKKATRNFDFRKNFAFESGKPFD
jgi:hypothetical protein